jgi:uracil-DNA glycosylase
VFELAHQVDPSWLDSLSPQYGNLRELGNYLEQEEQAGRPWLPVESQVLRAFTLPLDRVRVVIVGQDPYPTVGHAVGLAFSVEPGVALPRSLKNIYKELVSDIGCPSPKSGDLSGWSRQGVLLLNQVLTVGVGSPGSHHGNGWEEFTQAALHGLVTRNEPPPVFILWGKQAQRCLPILGNAPVILSPHPSPLSANRGFFNSQPFSRANQILIEQGQEPINWCSLD